LQKNWDAVKISESQNIRCKFFWLLQTFEQNGKHQQKRKIAVKKFASDILTTPKKLTYNV
jgi:hypothetical protein